MRIRGCKDQRLAGVGWIYVLGQLLADNASEGFGDDPSVEAVNLEAEIIRRGREVYGAGDWVQQRQRIARLEVDAVAGQLGLDANWRLLVHKPAVDHRFAQAVREDWFAEDLGRVQGRRCGQADA